MKTLYLTINPVRGGTTRILESFLEYGPGAGIDGMLGVREDGPLSQWAMARTEPQPIPTQVNAMRPLNKTWPVPGLMDARRMAKWAAAEGVDLIHCNEHNTFPFTSAMRRFFKAPRVCAIRYLVNRGFCEWAFRDDRRPDAVLWTSHFQKNHCAEAINDFVPEERQHVVSLGIDLDEFSNDHDARQRSRGEWDLPDDAVVFGTASGLRPRKRIHEFIEMIATLAKDYPQAYGVIAGGVIAGDEAYWDDCVKRMEQPDVKGRIRYVGVLHGIEPLMQAIDVFVSTSELETFGNSIAESMACSRPVIGYVGGSVGEVVDDTGVIVETGDLDGLTKAAAGLLDDNERLKELGRLSRRRVETVYNPRTSFEQLVSIYESVLGQPLKAMAKA